MLARTLVAEVKRQLDVELAPDGYNVGFNAGPAAGQTVMHLHVHVSRGFAATWTIPGTPARLGWFLGESVIAKGVAFRVRSWKRWFADRFLSSVHSSN